MSSLSCYFSYPAEESALPLTKLSTISVSSFFLPVNHLTHLLQEQYPAVRLVLSELSVSPLFRFLLFQYRVGLWVGLVSSGKVILVEHFEVSESVPADLAVE